MDEIFKLAYALLEEHIGNKIKLLLNIIFVGSISSLIFSIIYFEYEIIYPADFRIIYNFFIYGNFIIPFAIFYLTWEISKILGVLLFKVPNLLLSQSFKKRILQFSVTNELPRDFFNDSQKDAIDMAVNIPRTGINVLLDNLPKKEFMVRRMRIAQHKVEYEFNLLVRGLIALIIYYRNIGHFDYWLFTILMLVICFSVFLLVIAYQLAELIPFGLDILKKKASSDSNANL